VTIGMSAESERDHTPESERQIQATVLLARRRLLRGGLSAAPVIMTLASGPVSAGMCQTASAYGSMHPSGTRTSAMCAGLSPALWAAVNGSSYGPFPTNTSFAPPYFTPALANSPSFKKVIDPNNGFDPVACNCLAAFLNASTGRTPASILSAATAQAIWTSYKNNGFFEPTAGIHWYGPDIVRWITTTYS
jgi:hypothetical protein